MMLNVMRLDEITQGVRVESTDRRARTEPWGHPCIEVAKKEKLKGDCGN